RPGLPPCRCAWRSRPSSGSHSRGPSPHRCRTVSVSSGEYLSHRRPDCEGLPGAGNVMHPQDGSPQPRRLDREADRRRIALAGLLDPGQAADEALARGADQHRITGRREPARAFDQRQVLLGRLAEADAGIDGDVVVGDAGDLGGLPALEQEVAYILDDVAIGRPVVLVLGLAAAVHQHRRHTAPGQQRQHRLIVAQGRYVVDDAGAGIEAGPRDLGPAGIDRHHDIALGEFANDPQDAAQLLVDRRGSGARPCRLAADVDDVGALRNETQAIVDGLRRVEAFAAVGKVVRRHIHDRHHPRAIESEAAERVDQTPGCGSGLAPGDAPGLLLGTEARRRRSAPGPAPPVSSRVTFSPRSTWSISSRLSVSYSSSALAMVCRSSRCSVRMCLALPSPSSIRRWTSWSMVWAVASEMFCDGVTAWPRKTSCSLAW